jgi:Domain of Unknown Function (DUF1259)
VIGPTDRAAAAPDWKAVEQAIGKAGTLMPGGVYRVGLPRTDFSVTVQGVRVEAPFALGSYAAFKAMGNQAMVMGDLVLRDAWACRSTSRTSETARRHHGDFVLIASEVNPVVRTLRAHGIEVTAIHSHTLTDQPRLFYLHFWAHDEDAVKLAQGRRAALDLTNSRK